MSVAFTKEGDTENAAAVDLPDRPISPHPNLVTPRGLAQLEAAVARARLDYAANQADEAREGDRRALARAARDLRYFAARLASAQVVVPQAVVLEAGTTAIRFGSRVTIERADGRRQTLQLVGEDEADPTTGTISYVAPLARAVIGKERGDVATFSGAAVEIIDVD